MIRRPPRSTRTDTLFPYTTLFRAVPVASGLAVERLNFNYAISGDQPAWRPVRAFDDGRQTFIEFPPSIAVGETPPLFVIGDDSTAHLVNYRMAGRYYRSAERRVGKECVYPSRSRWSAVP